MRKFVAGLLVVGLLAMAGPAWALLGDPLTLINSGAIEPFFASSGNFSFLDIRSPVGPNAAPNPTHLVFFNASCTRTESVALPLTTNDIEVLPLRALAGSIDGLAVIAGSANGVDLIGLQNPIHTRVYWINIAQDFFRGIEGIQMDWESAPSGCGSCTWSPYRSGGTFFAPLQGATFQTTVYISCPTTNVVGTTTTNGAVAGAPFIPLPGATTIQGRVFDDKENFRRDISTACSCLTTKSVTDLSTIYTDAIAAPNGTYTELLGGTGAAPALFWASTAIRITDPILSGGSVDFFGRVNTTNRQQLDGTYPFVGQ
jgi:hypothetical protein